jgi:hypothetical protein
VNAIWREPSIGTIRPIGNHFVRPPPRLGDLDIGVSSYVVFRTQGLDIGLSSYATPSAWGAGLMRPRPNRRDPTSRG